MEKKQDDARKLMFLEPVSKDTDIEQLVERLITKLESLGFNIIGKDKEQGDEN